MEALIDTVVAVLTGEMPILSGVKQGDPLSRVLFNIALDPLITAIEGKGQGVAVGTCGKAKHTCLAFADDMMLVSHTWKDM